MAKFSIGDRVRCVVGYGEGATKGDTGTVVGDDGYWTVYVEWDKRRMCRHDCGGRSKKISRLECSRYQYRAYL